MNRTQKMKKTKNNESFNFNFSLENVHTNFD